MAMRRADAVALPGGREGYHLMADQASLRELGYPSRGSPLAIWHKATARAYIRI